MAHYNTDGYGIVIINENGDKALAKELTALDKRLNDYISEGDCHDFFADCVLGYQGEEELKNCFVLATYRYQTLESRGFDYVEYEDDFIIEQVTILRRDYKEFWRDQLSIELTIDGHRFGTVDELLQWKDDMGMEHETYEHYLTEDVEEWELFYDEEFQLSGKYKNKENYESYQTRLHLKSIGFHIEKID